MGRSTYIKGVTVRFGFDVSESRKFNCLLKQSNGHVSWDVSIQPLLEFMAWCFLYAPMKIYESTMTKKVMPEELLIAEEQAQAEQV